MNPSSGVNIIRYHHSKNEASYTDKLITCFQDVFAEPPWNEWKRCPVCNQYWGTDHRETLAASGFTHCEAPVVDYWPTQQVREDLDHEISPHASCWLAVEQESVVGFCWGYEATIEYLEDRLKIQFQDDLEKMYGKGHRIAYQDELGVLNHYRGKKIAKDLFMRRHMDFRQQGLSLGIVRTRRTPEPSVTYLWFTQRLGYQVITEYPSDDGRVVLGQTLEEVERLA